MRRPLLIVELHRKVFKCNFVIRHQNPLEAADQQTDMLTAINTNRQTYRQTETQTATQTHIETDYVLKATPCTRHCQSSQLQLLEPLLIVELHRKVFKCNFVIRHQNPLEAADQQTDMLTAINTNRQTYRQTETQTATQTHIETDYVLKATPCTRHCQSSQQRQFPPFHKVSKRLLLGSYQAVIRQTDHQYRSKTREQYAEVCSHSDQLITEAPSAYRQLRYRTGARCQKRAYFICFFFFFCPMYI